MPYLRVGYVNSRGLNEENWQELRRWVERDVFDLATVAATVRPVERTGSRYKGGMCVLASAAVASRIEEVVTVEETAITIRIDSWQISGVYLPPTLPPDQVYTALAGLAASDVVLGDFNIHFSLRY
ncbi:hypothetical protein BDY17DRAFT_326258 [Neohortaea acidophila]|uniref:Endonuclease/exonuclease/phosphatase domain-containing protein n=1 Tax=Neohortaea acidophila TaxID=245834 RepID=A0A6A6PK11_9PEZI|nr:uncharacterized protein BDY17DRAFT_326258 [Neohortaea acidophila]KAF2480349.1 hypothetical protein BDY17DRAFT_326258 [Neohortaea acidophila]